MKQPVTSPNHAKIVLACAVVVEKNAVREFQNGNANVRAFRESIPYPARAVGEGTGRTKVTRTPEKGYSFFTRSRCTILGALECT